MRAPIAIVTIVFLAACASAPQYEPWHPSAAGCEARSIHETLLWPEEAPLSAASFRLAVSHDTGKGPTVLLVLDSGKLVNLGNDEPPPHFLAAVGDSRKTCAVRMPWEDCPAVASVYETLKSESIPLGFEFETPSEILVFHAPTYYLGFADGQGNHNQWRFYGLRHPLQQPIEEAVRSLRPCWEAAEAAYNAF